MSEDELAEALRRELRGLTSDIRPRARLARRLDAIPGTRRQHRSRPWILAPAGALAAASIAVVLLVFSGSEPPAAEALTLISGGRMVLVSLKDIETVGPANAKLKTLGRVRAVAMTATCRTPTTGINYQGFDDPPEPDIQLGNHLGGNSTTVFIAARRLSPTRIVFALGEIKGPAPACVSSKGIGPGIPGFHFSKTSSP